MRKPREVPPDAEKYSGYNLLILSDFVEVSFYFYINEKLVRNIKYKINTKKNLEELKLFGMQKSFDPAFDKELNQQGRRSRINTPNINDYEVKLFAARKFSRQRWSNVPFKERYESMRRIKPNGDFSDVK